MAVRSPMLIKTDREEHRLRRGVQGMPRDGKGMSRDDVHFVSSLSISMNCPARPSRQYILPGHRGIRSGY